MNIKQRLKNYKHLVAEIKKIDLDIEEIHDSDYIGPCGISYEEKAAPTNKFNSDTENQGIKLADETIKLEKEKRSRQREVERIQNALSILTEEEKKIIEILYLKGMEWRVAQYQLDKEYSWCKRIEKRALEKIQEFLN